MFIFAETDLFNPSFNYRNRMEKLFFRFFVIFLLAPFSLLAQPTGVLEAVGATSFCESGTVTLRVKIITSSYPVFFKYSISGVAIVDAPESQYFESDLVDGGWIEFTQPIGQSATIKLEKVWDASINSWSSSNGVVVEGQSVDISVYKTPAPVIGSYAPACGTSIALNATPDPMSTTYHWEAAGGTFSDDKIANPVFTSNAQAEGVFPLKFIQQNGVCLSEVATNVTLQATPKATLSGSKDVCLVSGATYEMDVQANLTGHAPFSYEVTDGGSQSITRSNQSVGTATFKVPATGHQQTYRIASVIDANGCQAVAADITGQAVVNDLSPTANAGADVAVCAKTAMVSGSHDKGVGSWSFISNAPGAVLDDATVPTAALTAQQYGVSELQWEVNHQGCVHADRVTVFFNEPAGLALIKDQLTVCEGQSVEMDLSLTGKAPWRVDYTDGSQTFSSDINLSPASIALDNKESANYTIQKVTSADGCVGYPDALFPVTVEPLAPANAGADQVLGRAYAVELSASPLDLAGYWEVDNPNVQLSDVNDPLATATRLVVGKNVFRWVTLATVCPSTSDEVVIEVSEYTTYRGFSPNGDGINDFFEIDGINDALNGELTVYDQNGKQVYNKRSYDNRWSGEGLDGHPLPEGIYYYEYRSDHHEALRDYVVLRRHSATSHP